MTDAPLKILLSFYGYEGYGNIPISWEIPFIPSIGDNISINIFSSAVDRAKIPRGFSQGVVRRIVWTRVDNSIAPIIYISPT